MIRAILGIKPFSRSTPLGWRLSIWWETAVEMRLQRSGGSSAARHHRAIRWLGETLYLTRRWLQGARKIETAGGIADIHRTAGCVGDNGFDIDFSGACPVQGDGEIDGRVCYYRSRGEGWQFHVAPVGSDDVFAGDAWTYSERKYCFPDGGWVTAEVSIACIRKAVALFRAGEESQ
jgi:hypothetical protein